jgi:hypothetical protein
MDGLLYTLWMTGPIPIFQDSSVLSTDLFVNSNDEDDDGGA